MRALRIFQVLIRGFRALARVGFTVRTGGGPGVMEAANRGAKELGGASVGCNIALPQEQEPNRYLDRSVTFRHFMGRKLMLVKYSSPFIALLGGFGTLDELFAVATLLQTGTVRDFPIVLTGAGRFGVSYPPRARQLLGERGLAPAPGP